LLAGIPAGLVVGALSAPVFALRRKEGDDGVWKQTVRRAGEAAYVTGVPVMFVAGLPLAGLKWALWDVPRGLLPATPTPAVEPSPPDAEPAPRRDVPLTPDRAAEPGGMRG
jgi:hypothetical protein